VLADQLLADLGEGERAANMQNTLAASSRRRASSKMTGTTIIKPTPTVSGVPMAAGTTCHPDPS